MTKQPAIYHWHIVIAGFLQDEGKPTGMVRLWSELREHCSPECCVELRNWDDNWRQLAELIWRLQPDDGPVVKIYAYSWGGASAMILARELRDRGIGVDWIVLSDPVYRPRWWFRLWRIVWGNPRIKVPDNVRNVSRFYQKRNWPRGHRLALDDYTKTKATVRKELNVVHPYMDDAREFHAECQRVARS